MKNFYLRSETRYNNGGLGLKSHIATFDAKREYMNATIPLLSKEDSGEIFLEAGEQSFPFKVVLPVNCPSSFYHKMGRIGYSITGTIDIPWSFDKHTDKTFTIINIIDLNRFDPSIRLPKEVQDSKSVLLASGGPILSSFRIEKSEIIIAYFY